MRERPSVEPSMHAERARTPEKETIRKVEMVFGSRSAAYRLLKEQPCEDTGFVSKKDAAAGIFDGMGGHASGEVASQIANDVIEEAMRALRDETDVTRIRAGIEAALQRAHEQVSAEAIEQVNNMGTTAVVARVVKEAGKNRVVIGWVGDSRAILVRDGVAQIMTLDDAGWLSKVKHGKKREQMDIQATVETEEELPPTADPKRLVREGSITQHLGQLDANYPKTKQVLDLRAPTYTPRPIKPHTVVYETKPGDLWLLCSDGITDVLTLPQIADAVHGVRTSDIPNALMRDVTLVNTQGDNPRKKDDDVSVAIISVE